MKTVLSILLLMPFVLASQNQQSGTIKVRKKQRVEAYASIAAIFEGTITKATILKNPTIILNTPFKGEIFSFKTSFVSNGVYRSYHSKGDTISPKALMSIQRNNMVQIYFEEIYARLENDTFLLNAITLSVSSKNSIAVNPKRVAVTQYYGNITNSIPKSNPNKIRAIKGLYNGKKLKLKSFNVNYTVNGDFRTKKIYNEENLNSVIQLIKILNYGTRLSFTNITFEDGIYIIRGTPINLKIVN